MYINKTLYNHAIQEIKKNNENLYKIQEAISTGKQINRPSDNPLGTKQVLNYRTILSNINQYSENIEFARDWSQYTNDTLEAVDELLVRCREIAQTNADSTATEETRKISIREVNNIYQDLLSLANSKHDGRYLFAPEKRENDSPPFDPDTGVEDVLPGYEEFFMQIKIADEKKVQINTGRDVFTVGEEGENIFQVVDQLKSSLENNDPLGLRAALEDIDLSIEQVNQHLGTIGTKIKHLDQNQEILNKIKENTEINLSRKEDADITEKVVEYMSQSNNYSISLSTLSKILNTNLLDLIS